MFLDCKTICSISGCSMFQCVKTQVLHVKTDPTLLNMTLCAIAGISPLGLLAHCSSVLLMHLPHCMVKCQVSTI